jgi:hypothetical protein
VAASGLSVKRGADGSLWIAGEDGLALPVAAAQTEIATPLLGLVTLTAAGIWDGRSFTLLAADTPLGFWAAEGRP